MIKISDTVQSIIENDPIALEALQKGILNMSAYAVTIHKHVEDLTRKEVMIGSIVVVLARIEKRIQPLSELRPQVKLNNINIKGGLTELTYEKTKKNSEDISTINLTLSNKGDFFALTEGLAEITILCLSEKVKAVTNHMHAKPKSMISDLVAITVNFSSSYVNVPNIIYALISVFVVKRVNIIEIISTFTELSFIVSSNDVNKVLLLMQSYSDFGDNNTIHSTR